MRNGNPCGLKGTDSEYKKKKLWQNDCRNIYIQ